jgi:hypothetical protein
MTFEESLERITRDNHKLGRGEAVLDCMNLIEAEVDVLYQAIDARRAELHAAKEYAVDDCQTKQLTAQKDILLKVHKALVNV